MIEMSVFYGDKKISKVYRVDGCFRYMVFCHNKENDFARTEFFYTEQQAENFAEEWINE